MSNFWIYLLLGAMTVCGAIFMIVPIRAWWRDHKAKLAAQRGVSALMNDGPPYLDGDIIQ